MKRKVQAAVDKISDTVFSWDSVESVCLMDSEDDIYDPYFFLSVDIYYTKEIPAVEMRKEQFSYAGAFETAGIDRKDRFIFDDLPVRLEYKSCDRFNELITRSNSGITTFRDSGTYSFYRLANCSVLQQKTNWIDSIRKDVTNLDESFWLGVRNASQGRMEHYLSDLSAATIRNERLFFIVSLSGFIQSLCSTLFAINRKFEPSARHIEAEVLTLDILPSAFNGKFETILRNSEDMQRKREIAQHLAKQVVSIF